MSKRREDFEGLLFLAERELSFLQENLSIYPEIERSPDGKEALNGIVGALLALARLRASTPHEMAS